MWRGGLRYSLSVAAPFLHRHYPASPVLRAFPPPHSALSDCHQPQVGRHDRPRYRASLVACVSLLCTCCHHYPGTVTGSTTLLISPGPISLPRTGGQVGLCNVFFEDCSVFTHVTACTLAKSPSDPLHRRLQPLRYLHDCSDCFRLEQNRRVGFAPTEKRRLCTAHARTRHPRLSCEGLRCRMSGHL